MTQVNEIIYEQTGDVEGTFDLEVCSNGLFTIVKFLGNQIWSSEDDDREFLDDHTTEPLLDYLVGKIEDMVAKIQVLDQMSGHIDTNFEVLCEEDVMPITLKAMEVGAEFVFDKEDLKIPYKTNDKLYIRDVDLDCVQGLIEVCQKKTTHSKDLPPSTLVYPVIIKCV